MSYDDEDYREVTLMMKKLNIKSVIVEVPKMQGEQVLARSLIHGADDKILLRYQHACPVEITIRIFNWKADQLHLS